MSRKNQIITVIVILAFGARILAVVMSEREKRQKAEQAAREQASRQPSPASGPVPAPAVRSTPAVPPSPVAPRAEQPAQPAKPAATPPAPAAPAAQGAAGAVRVGTWNIEWLGNPAERSGQGQGTAQSPDDIASYIDAADVQALALEEIVATSSEGSLGNTRPRSAELDAAFAILNKKPGASWQYVLNPGRGGGGRGVSGGGGGDEQLTGIAWNAARVTAINDDGKPWDPFADRPWRLPIKSGRSAQGSGLWNRPPHAMKLSFGPGKTDVVLVVLHMKADYNGAFAAHRDEEAKSLLAALPTVESHFHDRDIVLLGDTNVTDPNEPCLTDVAAAGYADLNAKSIPTHWRGGATDRIFVPASQPEFKGRRFEVMSDRFLESKRWKPADFKRRLSDHYMAVTTISIDADDD